MNELWQSTIIHTTIDKHVQCKSSNQSSLCLVLQNFPGCAARWSKWLAGPSSFFPFSQQSAWLLKGCSLLFKILQRKLKECTFLQQTQIVAPEISSRVLIFCRPTYLCFPYYNQNTWNVNMCVYFLILSWLCEKKVFGMCISINTGRSQLTLNLVT